MSTSSTHLLKDNLREVPSHTGQHKHFIDNKSQIDPKIGFSDKHQQAKCHAKRRYFAHQQSSTCKIFFAEVKAHESLFQKGDPCLGLADKMLGLSVTYLYSRSFFPITSPTIKQSLTPKG